MNTLEKVKQSIIDNVEKEASQNPHLLFDLWRLKNNHAFFSDTFTEGLDSFVKKEISKGYNEDDLTFYMSGSLQFIYLAVTNKISGASFSLNQFITLEHKTNLTKQQLDEAYAPIASLITVHRKLIGDEKACIEFLNSERFLQNNLTAMFFDQETHDFVLSVKTEIEAKKKAALEVGRNELLAWATINGSELLKLRIKHKQNWQSMAETEWAMAHVEGEFKEWDYVPDSKEDWTVMNATLEQLRELEKAQAENPNCIIDIMRSKFSAEMYDVDDTPYIHRTFLRCIVPTPTKNEYKNELGKTLYREISDISDEE